MNGWVSVLQGIIPRKKQGIIPKGWDENSNILDTTSILRSLAKININHGSQSLTITTMTNAHQHHNHHHHHQFTTINNTSTITTITSITNAITTLFRPKRLTV